MSKGRVGLIKAIREVFREVKFFGDAEIATLRKELGAHKLQLEQLKAAREEQQRREEELALLEMRRALEHVQQLEGLVAEQDARLEAAAEALVQKAAAQQERDMMQRAMDVMHGKSMQQALMAEEKDLEEQLARLKSELQAELDAAGRGQPSPASSGRRGSSKPGKQR